MPLPPLAKAATFWVRWWRFRDVGIEGEEVTRIKRWAILVAGAVGFALGYWVGTSGSKECAQTPGIVLIDELDIHLHPQWQRQIANGLKAAFPNIQFITASHSPQILGGLKAEEIMEASS
jgi:hypothetical protein